MLNASSFLGAVPESYGWTELVDCHFQKMVAYF
jgi:hypothetical protein